MKAHYHDVNRHGRGLVQQKRRGKGGNTFNDHFVSYAAMISGILCNQRAPSTPLLNACCTNSSFIERVYHARSGFHMLPARLWGGIETVKSRRFLRSSIEGHE